MIYGLLSLSRWFCLALRHQMSSFNGTLFTQTVRDREITDPMKDWLLAVIFISGKYYCLPIKWNFWRFRVFSGKSSLNLGNETILYLLRGPNGFSFSWMVIWRDKHNTFQTKVLLFDQDRKVTVHIHLVLYSKKANESQIIALTLFYLPYLGIKLALLLM